jgi:hypothetical protein
MPLEEPQTHREWIEVWKMIHADMWERYANLEANERLLLEGAEKYGRPSQIAVDRSFQDVRHSLVPVRPNLGDSDYPPQRLGASARGLAT